MKMTTVFYSLITENINRFNTAVPQLLHFPFIYFVKSFTVNITLN